MFMYVQLEFEVILYHFLPSSKNYDNLLFNYLKERNQTAIIKKTQYTKM